MTLIYNRPLTEAEPDEREHELPSDKPVMHALVIGVGRFPRLPKLRKANRQTCADSARTIVGFLMGQALVENFETQLATVECLISDPSTITGQRDQITKTHPTYDPRRDEDVDPGTLENVELACEQWLERCRPENPATGFEGDHLLLYICSHGVAGRDEGALAVLEDVTSEGLKKWRQLLSVGSIARHVPAATKAGAVWVFLDACQEVLPELVALLDGNRAHVPVSVEVSELTECEVTSLALAGSNFGQFAHAPRDGGTAYFTQALIEGLSNCCVERTSEGWFSTAKEIPGGIVKVANAAFGTPVHTEILKAPTYDLRFLKVAAPQIPIGIASQPSGILRSATQALAFDSLTGGELASRAAGDTSEVWRLRVRPSLSDLRIEVSSPVRPAPFTALTMTMPPAQWVEINDED